MERLKLGDKMREIPIATEPVEQTVTKWILFESLVSPLTAELKQEVTLYDRRTNKYVIGKVVKIEMEDGSGSSFNVTLQDARERRVIYVRTVD